MTTTAMSGDAPTPTPPMPSPEYLGETMQGQIIYIMWTVTVISLAFVIGRCYTRLVIRSIFGADDWLMCFSMVCLTVYTAMLHVAANAGLGRHIEYVIAQGPQKAQLVGMLGLASQPFVIMGCAFGKTSFALTLLRIAPQRWMHLILWFIITTMMIVHVVVSICIFARCERPESLWNPTIPSNCWPDSVFTNFAIFVGTYSALTDFLLALLPWLLLWRLNMRKKEKFAVAIAMSLGVVAAAVAVIKVVHLSAFSDPDASWAVASLLWWAGVENGLIIVGACVPCLRPFLVKIFPSSSSKSNDSNSLGLKPLATLSMFTPKNKTGQWSAIVETEARPEEDDHSDRSILERKQKAGTVTENDLEQGANGTNDRPKRLTRHITKTTQVSVDFDHAQAHEWK